MPPMQQSKTLFRWMCARHLVARCCTDKVANWIVTHAIVQPVLISAEELANIWLKKRDIYIGDDPNIGMLILNKGTLRVQTCNKSNICVQTWQRTHFLLISGGWEVDPSDCRLTLKDWEILLRLLVSFRKSVNTPSSWVSTNWIWAPLFA